MLRFDLTASLAHARMLFERGVLGSDDAKAILEGLSGLLADAERGALEVSGPDEDIHSWIERHLRERIGDPALRVHTARSRNDQTGIALRLYVREALRDARARRARLRRRAARGRRPSTSRPGCPATPISSAGSR